MIMRAEKVIICKRNAMGLNRLRKTPGTGSKTPDEPIARAKAPDGATRMPTRFQILGDGDELVSNLCTATYPKQNRRTANPSGSRISGGLGSLSGSDKLP